MKNQDKTIHSLDFKGALKDSFIKLRPDYQMNNLVMFIVYIGCIISTLACIWAFIRSGINPFNLQICLWLWFTVIFANFAEAIAERKGKAQADSLKKSQVNLKAKIVLGKKTQEIPAEDLKKSMIILCVAGDTIPVDGEIIEGIASIDESAMTGESAPVIREAGGDRSGVMAGTKVLSDSIKIKVCSEKGNSYLDQMVALIEGAQRKKSPNEISLNLLLNFLTLLFIVCVFSLKFFIAFIKQAPLSIDASEIVILTSLLVCLAPTTISALLSAVGISGMERLMKKNVLAKSGKAVETAGDIDVLILDKTGTITYGNRMAHEITPALGVSLDDLSRVAFLASIQDQTPEGKSIIQLLYQKFKVSKDQPNTDNIQFIEFSSHTRMSGADLTDEKGNIVSCIRKGSTDAIRRHILNLSGEVPSEIENKARQIAQKGGTPLLVSIDQNVLGIIYLKDTIKPAIKERFEELRKIGIKSIMVTGDNPFTAASIAAEAGLDDFLAEATPEDKLRRIIKEQSEGKLVGMIGDGTNDAPALAQADIGIAMNSGTQAAKEASNMVDLDCDPTKLIDVVETGKELLMTRGALTTFSIANDISKYFTILPAVLAGVISYNGKDLLSQLNLLHLSTPQSAILSTVIFNALIIVALIPMALSGVGQAKRSAQELLFRNVFVFGLGGMFVPFIAIKLIDKTLTYFGLI